MRKSSWLVLLLLLPSAQALFIDVLPLQPTGMAGVTAVDGMMIATHNNGLVLGLDQESGQNVWSESPATSSPTRIEATANLAILGYQDGSVYALDALTGHTVWELKMGSAVTGIAYAQGSVSIVSQSGTLVTALASSGDQTQSVELGFSILAMDRDAQSIVVTGFDDTHVVDSSGTVVQTLGIDGTDVALASHGLYVIDTDGDLQIFHAGTWATRGALEGTYAFTTVAAGSERAVVGDAEGLIHVVNPDGSRPFPAMATYALRVQDLYVDDDTILGAFASGWLGVLPMRAAPVVLITEPQEFRFLPGTAKVTFAYAQPLAGDDIVTYRVQVRPKESTQWQTAASGVLPISPLTRIHTVNVDLSVFPSGTAMEMQVLLQDFKRGESGHDRFIQPLLVDHDLPRKTGPEEIRVPSGTREVKMAPTDLITHARPSVLIGHRDDHSGVRPGLTTATIDGSPDFVDLEAFIAYSRITPMQDLADGRHSWTVTVRDAALNQLTLSGNFIIDTAAPSIHDVVLEATASNAGSVSFTTNEPAECEARIDGDRWTISPSLRTDHAGVLDDIEPGQTHDVVIHCTDAAGRAGTTQASLTTPPLPPGAPQPVLTVSVSPATPDGTRDWYTSVPTVTGSTDMDATIQWSLDQAPFTTALPTLSPGLHHVQAYAISDQGVASARFSQDLRIDPSPPIFAELQSLDPLRAVHWDPAEDEDSGIERYLVEARIEGGDWFLLGTAGPTAARYEEIPLDAVAVRVRAENGAGLQTHAPEVAFERDDERIHTLASIKETSVLLDGFVTIQYLLAHEDRFATALLVDEHGIEYEFSDSVLTGPRRHEVSSHAGTFGEGTYEAKLRIYAEGTTLTTLDAGYVTILAQAPDVADPDDETDPENVRRESPALPWAGLALALFWLARKR